MRELRRYEDRNVGAKLRTRVARMTTLLSKLFFLATWVRNIFFPISLAALKNVGIPHPKNNEITKREKYNDSNPACLQERGGF